MSSPYGPSGGQEPQQPWGQQPYGGAPQPGTPSGGFPAQGGYPPPQHPGTPSGGFPAQGGYPPQQQPYGYGQPQPTQQYPGYPPQQPGYPGGPDQGQQQYPGGYGPPPGGYPGQPGPPPPPKKKSSAWIWLLVALLVVAAAVAVLGFVTPGWFNKRVFDQAAVQDGVRKTLVDSYRADSEKIESVSCPSGEPVRKDHRFSCTVRYGGQEFQVDITVRDEAQGQYEVANPNLPD